MDFNIQLNNTQQNHSYSPNSANQNPDHHNKYPQNYLQTINDPKTSEQLSQKQPTGCLSYFTIQYYQPFFNISQNEVIDRIKKSITPWTKNFFQNAHRKPDLYGPFWILTTIVFLLSSIGNLSLYLYNWDNAQFHFKLQLARYAVLIVYSIGLGFPILLGFLLKFFQSQISIIQMICLYGYSLSCFIPIIVLCVVPISVIQWILIIYGMINSTAFIILSLRDAIQSLNKQKSYLIYGLIAVCQLTLFLTFKLMFFKMEKIVQEVDS